MPFVSSAQRRCLFATHPAIAREFADATPKGAKLPEHVADKSRKSTRPKAGESAGHELASLMPTHPTGGSMGMGAHGANSKLPFPKSPVQPGKIGTPQPPRSPLAGAPTPSQATGIATTSVPTVMGPALQAPQPAPTYNAGTTKAASRLEDAMDRFEKASMLSPSAVPSLASLVPALRPRTARSHLQRAHVWRA